MPALGLFPKANSTTKIRYPRAVEADLDPNQIKSNTFEMEWPPKSGKRREFPEVDKAAWFLPEEGMKKINPAQAGFIRELEEKLKK